MKRIQRFFAIALLLVVVLTATTNAFAVSDATRIANERAAYSQYLLLIDLIEIENSTRIATHLPVMPEFYGGAYVDETGRLNIMLTEDVQRSNDMNNFLAQNRNVITHRADLSYNHLNSILNLISAGLTANDSLDGLVVSCELDERNNCINVFMTDCSKEKQNLFKETIYDGVGVEFIITSAIVEDVDQNVNQENLWMETDTIIDTSTVNTTNTYNLGQEIIIRLKNPQGQYGYTSAGSIGMGATLDGYEGFFTAAHVCNVKIYDGITYTPDGNCYVRIDPNGSRENFSNLKKIGTIVNSELMYGGDYDNVFIRLESGHTISPYLTDGKAVSAVHELANPGTGIDGQPLQGAAVQTCGKTTGVQSGYVISTNATIQNGTATNMIHTSTPVNDGDSGGILSGVLLPFANTFCGIIKAKETVDKVSCGAYSVAYATLKNHYFARVSWKVAPLSP